MRRCNQEWQPVLMVRDGLYVAKVWFVAGSNFDWLACARHDDEGKWILTYRFRYYVDDKVHDSKDVKRFYVVEIPSEVEAIEAGNKSACMIASGQDIDVEQVLVKSDNAEEIYRLVMSQPWCHLEGRELSDELRQDQH